MDIIEVRPIIRAIAADRIVASLRGQSELLSQLAESVESCDLSPSALERRINEVESNLRKLRAAV